ncbi:MAG: zinc ribbon domain-containing protein [Candidatus Omnitrophica bacterium]|nr:zinc ribbon domain-containing protein [Candidatus Omnitrophota bacterium]
MNLRKCPNCNKDISVEAKFCGFCGTQLPAIKPAKVKKNKSSRTIKQISFAAIFLLYLSFSYFTNIGHVITVFYERSIELEIFSSEFQSHFIDSLIYIFDFICSIFFVGLFAYWFKGLRTWIYLTVGLLMKYWLALLLAGLFIFKGQFFEGDWPDSLLYILIIQITAVLIGSFIGAKIAAKFDYSDKKDRTNFFFYGLSKKFWFLMTIAYNPILEFLSKLSVFAFYTGSKSITDVSNWSDFFSKGYFVGVLIVILIPFVLLAVSLKLFAIGIEAVKNKQVKFRKFKIVTFLIVMPILTVLIPIIRNRAWFF